MRGFFVPFNFFYIIVWNSCNIEDTLGKKFSSLDNMLEQLTTKGGVDLGSIMKEKFGDLKQPKNAAALHDYMLDFETPNQMFCDLIGEDVLMEAMSLDLQEELMQDRRRATIVIKARNFICDEDNSFEGLTVSCSTPGCLSESYALMWYVSITEGQLVTYHKSEDYRSKSKYLT